MIDNSGPSWPVPELIAAGVPAWLALLIAVVGLLLALILGAFLIYCVWAGTRGLPRRDDALEVLVELDPAVTQAFGVWDTYDQRRRGIDVQRLAALKPLLEEETRVRAVDTRLQEARDAVAAARGTNGKKGGR